LDERDVELRMGGREERPTTTRQVFDPALVARLRAAVEAEDARRPKRKVVARHAGVVERLLAHQRAKQAELNEASSERCKMQSARLSREELIRLHVERYQKGDPTREIEADVGATWATILRWFRQEGLPVGRSVEDRFWRPERGEGARSERGEERGGEERGGEGRAGAVGGGAGGGDGVCGGGAGAGFAGDCERDD
jgi:hypothetical protein